MTTMTQTNPIYKRGDVILVLYPDSNLLTAKRRPALIVQENNLQTGLSQFIVAMITSNLSRANHQSRVNISPSSSEGKPSGLLADSVIMTDNLATIAESEVDRLIGHFHNMTQIDIALKHTLGLS